ncbi:MAG TPA: hypothetical protein VFS29_09195, partial [Motilibacteraceae bacterium]|nr:hypothetical protein [Motilibacteraceae bacterium]
MTLQRPQQQKAAPGTSGAGAARRGGTAADASPLEDAGLPEPGVGDGGLVERIGPRPAPAPRPAEGVPELPSDRFLDREVSWLQFNRRVLELAEDADLPLLERARFLAIFASNLDEFFMVRVAGLKRRIATGLAVRAASGLQPREVLEAIWRTTRELTARQSAVFHEQVMPALAAEGIALLRWNELDDGERERLHVIFRERVFPVLTPLAVDPAHPFPYISGLSLNLAVVV